MRERWFECHGDDRGSYGHFVRTTALPEAAKLDTAKATVSNGMLEVSLDVPAASH